MDYLIFILAIVIFFFDALPLIKRNQRNSFFTIVSLLIISMIFVILHLANFTSMFMTVEKIIHNFINSILKTH